MTTRLFLVRHAEAGQRRRWKGADELRPLSRKGRDQAARLVGVFRGIGVMRLVSSPYVRCIQTLEPLGAERDLAVEPAEDLREGTPIERAHALLVGLAEAPVALCTHGDVIEGTIGTLIESGMEVVGSTGFAKGSVWELHAERGRIVSGRYLSPPI